MTEITLTTNIQGIEGGLELAYAANTEYDEHGKSSPLYEHYCRRAGELIGMGSGVVLEELRIFHELPPFEDLSCEEKVPVIEKVQESIHAKLGAGMLERYLLKSVGNLYPELDSKAIDRAYLFGRGQQWYITRDGIVHRKPQAS